MMGNVGYEIDPLLSSAAPVARASALLTLHRHESLTYVLDVDFDRFVAVDLPSDTHACGLTPDGARIVLTTNRLGSANAGLYHLATRRQDWYGEEIDDGSHAATLSPNGRTLTYLCAPRDLPDRHNIAIRRYDITTGQRDTLWTGAGGLAAESALAWSPDGELLAVGLMDADDEDIVNVLDVNGRVRATYKDSNIVAAPNAAWLSTHELGIVRRTNGFELRSVNPLRRLRPHRRLGILRRIPQALSPDRMYIAQPLTTQSATGNVVRTRFDGTDPEPFATYPPAASTQLDLLTTVARQRYP